MAAAVAAETGLNPEAPEFVPFATTKISTTATPSFSYHRHHLFIPLNPTPLPYSASFYLHHHYLHQPLFHTQDHCTYAHLVESIFPTHLVETSPPPPKQPPLPNLKDALGRNFFKGDAIKRTHDSRKKKNNTAPPPKAIIRACSPSEGSRSHPSAKRIDGGPQKVWKRINGGKSGGGGGAAMVVIVGKKTRPSVPVVEGGKATTAMIRNIPNHYTREKLVQLLDQHCMQENHQEFAAVDGSGEEEERFVTAYDFVYLPIDFKTGCNKGYAFVNFTHRRALWRLSLAFNGFGWRDSNCSKICEIACASIQGKGALVRHFINSTFLCGSDDFLPACFSPPRDGSASFRTSSDNEPSRLQTIGARVGSTRSRFLPRRKRPHTRMESASASLLD